MGYGERSCTKHGSCDEYTDLHAVFERSELDARCTVGCPYYCWDGATPPDSFDMLTETQKKLMGYDQSSDPPTSC